MRLESSHSVSYLKCVSTSSGDSFTTQLGVSPFAKWHDNPSSFISFLRPFLLLSFFLRHPFHSSLIILLCLSVILVITCHSSSYVLSISTIYLHHLNHHIVFSLCPLEVNLDIYLTTWLSSCPVEYSLDSHHKLLISKS